jgi:hypothetical protein
MSQKGRINHVVNALKQSGFFPKDKSAPGCVDGDVKEALECFLASKKGKNVSRVINAFKTIGSVFFKDIPRSSEVVTVSVKKATKDFLERYHIKMPITTSSSIPEMATMKPWELQGPQSGI